MIQPPNILILDERIRPFCSAVTGRGETLTYCTDGDHGDIKVISSTGESKVVNLPCPKDGEFPPEESTLAVASDSNNNVYVVKKIIIFPETGGPVYQYVLFVLDENYNVKHDCILRLHQFLHGYPYLDTMGMAINKNNDIIMARHDDHYVYVLDDNTGQFKYKLRLDSDPLTRIPKRLSISDKNEIMIASLDDKIVEICMDETGKLKSTIPAPTGHKIQGLAFHYAHL